MEKGWKHKMAKGGEVDKELIDASAKSIYDKKGMMYLRNTFLQLAQTDEKSGDIETADYRRKVVADYQSKQPRYMSKGGEVGKKVYNTMFGVGSSKYVVNYHDGVKTHKDGSEFFDIATFKNKVDFNKFVNKLKKDGYVQGHEHGGKMAQGGGVGSKTNTYKLRAEGLNDFLAFLQKGMYFRVKSFTVETTSGPDVVVSFKTDASLSEIKSKLDEVPDSHVMLETIKPIKEYTGERNEEYAKGGWVLVDSDTERKLGEYATESKAREMMYEYEGNSMIVKKSEWDKLPPNPNRHSPAFYFKQGGGVGTSSKLKYSLYLDRTVGDNVTTYHIADFAAKGDLSIALESLKAAAPKNYMYYTK